jgi:type IV secretory pathway VirB10-like protein
MNNFIKQNLSWGIITLCSLAIVGTASWYFIWEQPAQIQNKTQEARQQWENDQRMKEDIERQRLDDEATNAQLTQQQLDAEEKAKLDADQKKTEEDAEKLKQAQQKADDLNAQLEAEQRAKLEAEQKAKLEAEQEAKLAAEQKKREDQIASCNATNLIMGNPNSPLYNPYWSMTVCLAP